jgi:hypothetical protein
LADEPNLSKKDTMNIFIKEASSISSWNNKLKKEEKNAY